MRAVTNLTQLGALQILLDCDVLQADGGTRTASVTGAYVALHLACRKIQQLGLITELPFKGMVAAVSCGLKQGEVVGSRPADFSGGHFGYIYDMYIEL